MEVSIFFGGFYESEHMGRVDSMIDSYYDEENYYSDDIDYSLIYREYSKRYVSFLNEYLKDETGSEINLSFVSLDSPREYNFRTDEIIANISEDAADSIIKFYSENDECKEFIQEASSTKPGFVSFYDGYNEVIKDKKIHLQYIFKYINEVNDDEFEQYYDFNCMYEMLGNINFTRHIA